MSDNLVLPGLQPLHLCALAPLSHFSPFTGKNTRLAEFI
jgi:hypothetical protein